MPQTTLEGHDRGRHDDRDMPDGALVQSLAKTNGSAIETWRATPPASSAPDERQAGYGAVMAIAERLSRIADTATVSFDRYLADVCDGAYGALGQRDGPTLSCTASEHRVPVGPAIVLGLIVEQLVTNALVCGFSDGHRAGRIAVSFRATPDEIELAVEDSGSPAPEKGSRRDRGMLLAHLLVLQLDGALEQDDVMGGTRWTVTVPTAGPAGQPDGSRTHDHAGRGQSRDGVLRMAWRSREPGPELPRMNGSA